MQEPTRLETASRAGLCARFSSSVPVTVQLQLRFACHRLAVVRFDQTRVGSLVKLKFSSSKTHSSIQVFVRLPFGFALRDWRLRVSVLLLLLLPIPLHKRAALSCSFESIFYRPKQNSSDTELYTVQRCQRRHTRTVAHSQPGSRKRASERVSE